MPPSFLGCVPTTDPAGFAVDASGAAVVAVDVQLLWLWKLCGARYSNLCWCVNCVVPATDPSGLPWTTAVAHIFSHQAKIDGPCLGGGSLGGGKRLCLFSYAVTHCSNCRTTAQLGCLLIWMRGLPYGGLL